eukprot:gene3883-4427_t
MDRTVVKKTQDTLGKVISKPPLTDKLLNKPPFRFLHDIITEVIKKTGVLKGLFKSDELNSENITDKNAKIIFLQKAIDCVAMLTGESLSARPSKIVAGHEPEKTNQFLQALGKACIKKMDSTDSVKKVLAGEKPSSGKSRKIENSEKTGDSKKRDDKKDAGSTKGSSRNKDDRERSSTKGAEKKKEEPEEKMKEKSKVQEEIVKETDSSSKVENNSEDTGNRSVQRPASAKGQRRRPTNQNGEKENISPSDDSQDDQIKNLDDPIEKDELEHDSNLRQQSAVRRVARPSSARPAPPKIRKNTETEDPIQRLGSGKQFNAVIVDNPKDLDDDDDSFVVEENLQNEPYFEQLNTDSQQEQDDGQHGSLVKKMLDSKRDADVVQSKAQQSSEKPIMMDATRRKEKELATKEEDIDSMQKELESITESETEPLQAQLGELELEITDMIDKISSVKSNIIKNDEKIHDLVSGISR